MTEPQTAAERAWVIPIFGRRVHIALLPFREEAETFCGKMTQIGWTWVDKAHGERWGMPMCQCCKKVATRPTPEPRDG